MDSDESSDEDERKRKKENLDKLLFQPYSSGMIENEELNYLELMENSISLTPIATDLYPIRETFNGVVKEIHEKRDLSDNLSLNRKPNTVLKESEEFVRGNSENLIFNPGGLIMENINNIVNNNKRGEGKKDGNDEINELLRKDKGLRTLPNDLIDFNEIEELDDDEEEKSDNKGIEIGKNFVSIIKKKIYDDSTEEYVGKKKKTEDSVEYDESRKDNENKNKKNIINLNDVFSGFDSFHDVFNMYEKKKEEETKVKEEESTEGKTKLKKNDSFDDLFQMNDDQFMKQAIKKSGSKWAITKRIDVSNFDKMVVKMAMTWEFDLDDWQKEAIYHIDNNRNVFVSAHTSAGKTVCAEYAIAKSKQTFTRTIYTSPIKTLSNQKFREFKKLFGDVGLITGDVQINPTASILIMTTEILRSMLYKGADIIRDISYVIFDEVHYINDDQRGVVWEEAIILLPQHISIVMLSASFDKRNTYDFADWIGRTKQKEVYVISTKKRPVPLEHYILYNESFFKIVDKNGDFLHKGYQSVSREKSAVQKRSKKKYTNRSSKADWDKLITLLEKKNYFPTVVFSFSRRKCETLAMGFPERVDLTTKAEKVKINDFFSQAIKALSEGDRVLPQIETIKYILTRGIGVHHSGLLPLVKEIVEIMFSKGLCKILFATETFAMGVNMPAKTVIFNGLRKHDGIEFRDLLASEYLQMAGRAGRRGTDKVGNVLNLCENNIPSDTFLFKLILGKSTELRSKFKLSYNMILNLLRVENFRVEDMIKRSFSEATNQRFYVKPEIIARTKTLLNDVEDVIDCIYEERPNIEDYYKFLFEIDQYNKKILNYLITSKDFRRFLCIGSIVVINSPTFGITFGIVYDIDGNKRPSFNDKFSCFVLLLTKKVKYLTPSNTGMVNYSNHLLESETNPVYKLSQVRIKHIVTICKNKMNFDEIKNSRNRKDATLLIKEVINLWKTNNLSTLKINDTRIKNIDFIDVFSKRKQILNVLRSKFKCYGCPKLNEHLIKVEEKDSLKNKLLKITKALSDDNLELLPELISRMKVLKQLKYINKDNTIQLKGRVATEVNSCESIIVTEMLFENMFNNLKEEEISSLLSCLICTSRIDETDLEIRPELKVLKNNLCNLVHNLGLIQKKCGMLAIPEEYLEKNIRIGLMEIAYEWCEGKSFAEIMENTEIQEGIIVRNIIQISQLAREVRDCCRVVGNRELMQKMDNVVNKIKRDIVFAASLYLK